MGVYSDYNKVLKEESELQSLNEAYYGITPDLQVALDKLSKFREKYIYDENNSTTVNFYKTSNINTNKYLIEFNRKMEEIFGFELFSMQLIPSSVQNGYTLPATIRSPKPLTKKDLTKTKNGIAYKKESKVKCTVFMYAGLVFNPEITDKGVLGVILHEIGHNFSIYQSKSIRVNNEIIRIVKPLAFLYMLVFDKVSNAALLYNNTTDIYLKVLDSIYESKAFSAVYDTFKSGANFIKDAYQNCSKGMKKIGAMFNPIAAITSIPLYIIDNIRMIFTTGPVFPVKFVAGWKDEKIADNYAAMYGCGPDLDAAMEVMERSPRGSGRFDSLISNSFFGNYIDIIYTIPVGAICCLFDEHPETIARANNKLKYIKAELKKEDIDPKLKKDLLKQEKEMEEVIEYMTKPNGSDHRAVRKVWNGVLLKLFDGDPRQAIVNVFDDDDKYNKKYDDLFDSIL